MKTILVIEDDEDIQNLLRKYLQDQYRLQIVSTIASAEQHLKNQRIDLALIDDELPDGRGIHFCSQAKKNAYSSQFPIIILTHNSKLIQKLEAFKMGASDYMVKPFEPLELMARIEVHLKHFNQTNTHHEYRDLILDESNLTLKIDEGLPAEGPIMHELTPVEFKLLYVLITYPERIFSRDDLLNKIYSENMNANIRSIDHVVCRLRKKLDNSCTNIITIRNMGYKMASKS